MKRSVQPDQRTFADWLQADTFWDGLQDVLDAQCGEKVILFTNFNETIDRSDLINELTEEAHRYTDDTTHYLQFLIGSHCQDFEYVDQTRKIDVQWNFIYTHEWDVKPWSEDKRKLLEQEVLQVLKNYMDECEIDCILPPNEDTRIQLIERQPSHQPQPA